MFSDKSVQTFLERIQAEPVREGWLQCRKDNGVFLQSDGRVHVLYAASFPWRKGAGYEYPSETVEYGREIQVGPWLVTADVQKDLFVHSQEAVSLLSQKAVLSIDCLMDGHITYYLLAPKAATASGSSKLRTLVFTANDSSKPRSLVFTVFTKANRPASWKNTDAKLQEKIPLLGNDEEATRALQENSGGAASTVVKVTLRVTKSERTVSDSSRRF
jgi:hypothetical protein